MEKQLKETKKKTKTTKTIKKKTQKNQEVKKETKKAIKETDKKASKKVAKTKAKKTSKANKTLKPTKEESLEVKKEIVKEEKLNNELPNKETIKVQENKDIPNKETIKVEENKDSLNEVKEVQKKSLSNSAKTLIIIAILLIVSIFIGIYANNTKAKVYTLSDLYPEFTDTATITLPHNYYFTSDCQIVAIEDDQAIITGFIYASEDNENNYESTMEYYASVTDIEELTVNGKDYKKLTQENNSGVVHYYYTKYDTHVIQAVFLNLTDSQEIELLNSIK